MKSKHECRSTGVCKKIYLETTNQDLQQVRNAMNAQEKVSEPSMDDYNICEQGHENDDTGADAQVEN